MANPSIAAQASLSRQVIHSCQNALAPAKISIVIPLYAELHLGNLARLLNSFLHQEDVSIDDFELIFVLNNEASSPAHARRENFETLLVLKGVAGLMEEPWFSWELTNRPEADRRVFLNAAKAGLKIVVLDHASSGEELPRLMGLIRGTGIRFARDSHAGNPNHPIGWLDGDCTAGPRYVRELLDEFQIHGRDVVLNPIAWRMHPSMTRRQYRFSAHNHFAQAQWYFHSALNRFEDKAFEMGAPTVAATSRAFSLIEEGLITKPAGEDSYSVRRLSQLALERNSQAPINLVVRRAGTEGAVNVYARVRPESWAGAEFLKQSFKWGKLDFDAYSGHISYYSPLLKVLGNILRRNTDIELKFENAQRVFEYLGWDLSQADWETWFYVLSDYSVDEDILGTSLQGRKRLSEFIRFVVRKERSLWLGEFHPNQRGGSLPQNLWPEFLMRHLRRLLTKSAAGKREFIEIQNRLSQRLQTHDLAVTELRLAVRSRVAEWERLFQTDDLSDFSFGKKVAWLFETGPFNPQSVMPWKHENHNFLDQNPWLDHDLKNRVKLGASSDEILKDLTQEFPQWFLASGRTSAVAVNIGYEVFTDLIHQMVDEPHSFPETRAALRILLGMDRLP